MQKRKGLIVFVVVTLGAIVAARTVFPYVGRSMAAEGSRTADVLVLEGADNFDKRLLFEAARQVLSGRVPRLVLATHQVERSSTDNAHSAHRLEMALHQFGLHDDQFTIVYSPRTHPITLNEASVVLKRLEAAGVHTVVLMTDGFHERRSYLVYKQVGAPLGITVTPSTVFLEYTTNNWWETRIGWYEFSEELAKTAYYYMHGYLHLSI